VTTADLGKLFASFRSSAFRLETLPEYNVTEDDEARAFRLFQDGQPMPDPAREREWPKFVRAATDAGKIIQRVRIMRHPPSEYIRFELAWGYPANDAAGEDIRILDHDVPDLLTEDYWLFDDALVVRLDYDHEGRFIAPVVVEDAEPYRRARDTALRLAVPFRTYLAELGDRPSLSQPR
jgi:hypothetical protein